MVAYWGVADRVCARCIHWGCTRSPHTHNSECLAHHTYQTMLNYYNTTTRPLRQMLFFQHKRPREEWDPTLWEITLRPLPKHQKAHWDPNKWKIQLH